MGNTWSAQREYEDQDAVHGMAYSQVSSEPPDNVKNGPVLNQSAQPVSSANGDAVDARVNVAVSSPKTMEISSVTEANGNNLGKEAKPAPPAARSRFVLAFSRPVPGRTEEQATNSSVASTQLDVSSEAPQANKASSEPLDLAAAAVPDEASDKNLSEASLSEIELTPPTEAEDAALPKPKELSFFDRLFKVEKAKDKNKKTQDQSQGEVKAETPGVTITVDATAGLQSTPENVLQEKDIVNECNYNTAQQDPADVNCLASEGLAQEEVKPETVKSAGGSEYNNAVMSFFKTLVSPSKADSKSDTEDKAKKDAQQDTSIKCTEQPESSVHVKSETNILPSQEIPATKQITKAPEPPVQQQPTVSPAVIITNETPKEITKERSSSTPTPLSKFFWKKTPTDDIEVIHTERIEAPPEAPPKDDTKSQEVAETKSKGDEKPSKTNLRKFFKLSVKSDARVTPSEEVNGEAPDHQTLDFTDRPSSTQAAEKNRESFGERSKQSSTEKLSKQKESKEEAKEQQDSGEQERAETDSLQNGGEAAKENTPRKTEKRQSFGGFFKGLSPKRTSDAEVQTDPVSIVPAAVAKPK